MGSIWRDMALQWLGGDGSAALAADSRFHDRFALGADMLPPAFRVTRVGEVSHAAMRRAAAEPSPPVAFLQETSKV
jgi:hypothetical protein